MATLLSHLMVVNEEYACRPLRQTLAYALDGRSQPRGRADDDRLGSTELLVAHQILAKFSEERGSVDSESLRRIPLVAAVPRRLFRLAAEVLRAIEAEVFHPNVGWQCKECPFKSKCWAWG